MTQKIPTIIADLELQLATAISIGATTFDLSSVLDDDGNTIPAGKYCFTIDNGSSNKEYLMGDIGHTSTVSGVVSVNRQGAETSGAVRAHRVGASVILTDFVALQRVADILRGALTLDAANPLTYDATASLSDPNSLATVAYVLSVVTGGTVVFNNQVITGQSAGENLTAGNTIYFKTSDQKWYKTDAQDTTKCEGVKLGIALSTTTINNTIASGVQLLGVYTTSGLTAGSKYYLSDTDGAISVTPGTYSAFVGWALSTTTLLFAPKEFEIPTGREKAAMAGSTGVPSSTNKFITQDNTSAAGTDQTQTTQNATVETGEANATTKKNKIAQSFLPTKTKMRGVRLYKSANTGTFTGTVTISLQADNAGSPSGSALATVTITNADYLLLSVGEFEATFGTEYAALVAGSLYWIVIETSTSDNSNHPNLGTNSAGGYSSGSLKYNNTTDGWVAIATVDLYFKTIEGTLNQIVKTDANGNVGFLIKASSAKEYISPVSASLVNGAGGVETTLFSATLPANVLFANNVNNAFRFYAYLTTFGRASSEGITFRIKYAGVTIHTLSPSGSAAFVAGRGALEGTIVGNNAINAQKSFFEFNALIGNQQENSGDASVGVSSMHLSSFASPTADSSVPQAFSITAQYNSGASVADNDITAEFLIIERLV